jgi:hypothetical protein
MSTTKSKNNMAGAWMNEKKAHEKTKSQKVVLESNQNGIRLKFNENCFFENVTINPENNFRWPILGSEPVITPETEEEDEEDDMEAYLKKQQDEMDALIKAKQAETVRIIKLMEAKKIAKSVSLLREQARDAILKENERIQATIDKLKADIAVNNTEIEATMRGDFDADLIKEKTDAIKPQSVLPPSLQQKPVKNTPTADGARVRTTINRPTGGDIFLLFNRPAIIRCVMNSITYFGLVEPVRKLIKCVKEDGTFNDAIDKGVVSHLTKTIKLADGKQKYVADISEPAKHRTEWTKKDDWIKCCKGEQNLYSSSKDGWKEIYYWTGNLNDPTKTDPSKWVWLYNVAYAGVKLN